MDYSKLKPPPGGTGVQTPNDMQRARHLSVLKKVYRKFVLGDARLGHQEVLDRVWDEICNDMGCNEAVAWSDEMADEIGQGNSE